MKECHQKRNADRCMCTYVSCQRRGLCCDCIAHHKDHGELPGCLFTKEAEKTYDRSVENFIATARK